MNAIKIIFLLSLLAIFLAPRETEAQATISPKWSKFGQCSQVFIESLTNLADRIVPTIYDMNLCSGYVAPAISPSRIRTLVWYLKVGYEFVKKLILDEPRCLLKLLHDTAATIKPYVNQINAIGCLDENDFLI